MLANVEAAAPRKGLSGSTAHCPDYKTMLKNVKATECANCPFDVSRCPGGLNDKEFHHHTNVGQPMPPPTTLPSTLLPKKTLVSYLFTPSPSALTNLQFFITHALHSQADFIFTIFSPQNSTTSIPAEILNLPSQYPNIKFLKKPLPDTTISTFASTSSPYQNKTQSTCPQHPLTPHFEILNGTHFSLKDKYSHFILLDSTVRGPFLPRWSKECWSDAFLSLLSPASPASPVSPAGFGQPKKKANVKMVGTGLACAKGSRPHLTTHILGLDKLALDALLIYTYNPSLNNGTLSTEMHPCERKEETAQKVTQVVREQGWEVVVLDTTVADVSSYKYAECGGDEERFKGSGLGGKKGETDPWEVLFVDSVRGGMEGGRMELLSARVKKGGYSSWEICDGKVGREVRV